jgi:L-fuconolactonase
MTVVDAHHHLWDPGRRRYPWLQVEALAPIRRTYDLADLQTRAAAAGVDRTVLVQTVADVAETQELLRTAADAEGLIAGVVGWVDLTAPDVADTLSALREGADGAHLVGVRHQVQDEDDPRWLQRPDVVRGLREVAAADLVYDLLVLPHQLPAAVAAVRAVPDGRFVLDHAGKPPIATGDLDAWAVALRALAVEAHVSCKLSGLVTEADWSRWTVADLRPCADIVLEAFGPGRVLAGSDWPVCELAASYTQVWTATSALLEGLSAGERGAVLGGTARVVYGL